MKIPRAVATALALPALLVLTAAPAAAATNDRSPEPLRMEGPALTCYDDTGATVVLDSYVDVVFNQHLRTDRAGEATHLTINMRYAGTFARTDTGEQHHFRGAQTAFIDLVEGTHVSSGLDRLATVPGGIVLLSAGRYDHGEGALLAGPALNEEMPEGLQAVCGLFGLTADTGVEQ